jgi:hypothetical protein
MKGQPGGGGSPEGQPEEAAQQGGSQERQPGGAARRGSPAGGQPGEAARQGAARRGNPEGQPEAWSSLSQSLAFLLK